MRKIFFNIFILICTDIIGQNKIFHVNQNDDIEKYITKAINYQEQNPQKNVTVLISSGSYHINKEIKISKYKHTGMLTLRACHVGKVIFYGDSTISKFSIIKKTGKLYLLKKELDPSFLSQYKKLSSNYDRFEIYYNNKRLEPARYPDNNFMQILDVTGTSPTENGAFKEGIIKYKDKELNSLQKGSYLNGFWNYDWDATYQKIDNIDTLTQTIILDKSNYGYRKGAKFYALNSFKFLTKAGEYYLDKSTNTLYLLSKNKNITIQIPCNEGLSMLNIVNNNITINGIKFIHGLNRAITTNNAKNVNIENCFFQCFGADCIYIINGSNINIQNCLFDEIGEKCILASGGDRKNLVSSKTNIYNNIFQNTSYFHFSYEQAINFSGCGLHVFQNEFYNMPSAALWISGNDAIIENNFFDKIARICDDQGAFDTYKDPSFRGLIFRRNYWKDIGSFTRSKVAAIRLDDMISGVLIEENFFDQCGSTQYGAIEIHGGKDNMIKNNTFFHCPLAISFHQFGNYWLTLMNSSDIQKKTYSNVNINSALYKHKYPELQQDIDSNIDRNYVEGNNFINCNKIYSYKNATNIIKNNQETRSHSSQIPQFHYGTILNPYK